MSCFYGLGADVEMSELNIRKDSL